MVQLRGSPRLLQPLLVTGLKVWHLRPGSRFYPREQFWATVGLLPRGAQAVLIFGEIDCREGLLLAVDKCRWGWRCWQPVVPCVPPSVGVQDVRSVTSQGHAAHVPRYSCVQHSCNRSAPRSARPDACGAQLFQHAAQGDMQRKVTCSAR